MLGLVTAVTELAGTWVKSKADSAKATAEAKATALKTAAQSTADWERIMAEASKNSWKDEWLTIIFTLPIVFLLFGEEERVNNFFIALSNCPEWYQYLLGTIVAASCGFRGAARFMGKK